MITALEEIAVNLDLRNAEYEKIKVQLEQLQVFEDEFWKSYMRTIKNHNIPLILLIWKNIFVIIIDLIFQEDNQALEDKMNHATSTLNAHLEECGPKIKNFKEAIYNIVRYRFINYLTAGLTLY